jgi:hypothetical protein
MRRVAITAALLIFVHVFTEAWQVVWYFQPGSEQVSVNYFLDKSAQPEGIPLLWWWKMLTDEILLCYVFFDYAHTALKTSRKKFMVVLVFFIYHLFDSAMFLYNYKQSHWLYIALLALDCVALVILFLPVKEKAKIIEMK